jgi:aerobic carbon-monoxide dehydrogenase large subunit
MGARRRCDLPALSDVRSSQLPTEVAATGKDGSPMVEPTHPVLAKDKVRHVGDPVAVVIAETLEQRAI